MHHTADDLKRLLEDDMKIETHPYNLREAIPELTRTLIVGTAPPPRFSNAACGGLRDSDFDFFYGSTENYMWDFLEKIALQRGEGNLFEVGFSSDSCIESSRKFLKRHRIWMRDILQNYCRHDGKECSPSDNDIVKPVAAHCTDFISVFESLDELSTIAFTSLKAAEWTFQKLEADGVLPCGTFAATAKTKHVKRDVPLEEYIRAKFYSPFWSGDVGPYSIDFFLLPPPSGQFRKKGFTQLSKLKIYNQILFGTSM